MLGRVIWGIVAVRLPRDLH